MQEEIWKSVTGYEGIYEVSSYGNLRSLDRICPFGKGVKHVLGKLFNINPKKNGYVGIQLSNGHRSNKKYTTVHILVAREFIPNNEGKPFINHINGIRNDNRIENLEWVTERENNSHYIHNQIKEKRCVGVNYASRYNKWKSSLKFKSKIIIIGHFDTEDEAIEARLNKMKELGIVDKYVLKSPV